ncbi:F-box/WD repeat-containing protein 7 [Hondaea fermentalgiana]|uniref:non-specific serine/threonine protein kinase n=1 Tax=Hondaea fermentalgiana TaxID=2315210 RepID=A0A2R5G7H1_9STRA|nr:F-box/WD repeat-containing protein 7 [Hondaea fermentalgiana]|eukprot:GBG25738.1 F-box/WD repeat-containing protein 7 [Hondaea fermentalgiana]
MGRILGTVDCVAQSADLVLAATSGDGYLRVWSKEEGALVLEMKTPNNMPANTVAVQDNLAAVGTLAGGLFLIDLGTSSVLHALVGHTDHVNSVILDGNQIISGSEDQTIRVWDRISGREILTIDAQVEVKALAAHKKLLVVASQDNIVRVFDRATRHRRPRRVLRQATGKVTAVAIDAQRMASGSYDRKVRVYAVPSFRLVRVLKADGIVTCVALEGDRIVSASFPTITVWDARNGDTLHVLQGHSSIVWTVSLLGPDVVSGSGNSAGSADISVRVWDAETGALTRVLNGTEAVRPIEEVLGAATGAAASAAAEKVLKAALANGDPAELGRCKLMIVGQCAAGKTSTVRSLLGMAPVEEHISTVGVELKRTDAESWEEIKDLDSGFERQVYRVAALRMAVQEQAASKTPQSTPMRICRKASNLVFGRRRSSAARPFVAEVQVELVPEAEVAQRFEYAEIEDMAGKTQSDQKIYFTIWDFAGQDVFYALHHIFLTREGGVFMVVFDMQELLSKQERAVEYLSFWLNSVKLRAPTAPIILVGTHYDEASVDLNEVEEILIGQLSVDENENIVPNSRASLNFFPIDNMSSEPDRASELRVAVEASASSLESGSRKISLRWLKVLDDLLMLDCDHVPFKAAQELATKYHVGEQTDELLSFFHELGMLVHLRATDVLYDNVVLNPQWLLNKLSRVIADDIHVDQIRYDHELQNAGLEKDFEWLRKCGIATLSLLRFLWNDEEVDFLVDFMRGAMLLSDWAFPEESLTSGRQSEPLYLVSSLLKNSTSAELDAEIADMDIGLTCVLDFSKFFLPDGVFARLLSLCVQYSGNFGAISRAPQLAGNQAIVHFNFSDFALKQTKNKIWIRIERKSRKPASTLKTLVGMFRGARNAIFRDLPWELLLQSPKDASALCAYDEVARARTSGADSVLSTSKRITSVADFDPFFHDGSLEEDEKGSETVEQATAADFDPFRQDDSLKEDETDTETVEQASVADFDPHFQDGLLQEDENDTGTVEQVSLQVLPAGLEYHVYLSHRQRNARETCNLIADKLESRGLKVWYDRESRGDLAKEVMRRGIRASKCYLLFLSKSVFMGAVLMELEIALQEKKPVLLVHENDPDRAGFVTFTSYIESAPKDAKHLLRESESIPFQRRLTEHFYEQLIARINAS